MSHTEFSEQDASFVHSSPHVYHRKRNQQRQVYQSLDASNSRMLHSFVTEKDPEQNIEEAS